jgi:hypothetical protein
MRYKDSSLTLTCNQGSTFTRRLVYKISNEVVNLTGYTARMQVRPDYTSDNLIVNLSVGNGITITGATGTIVITITAGATSSIPAGTYLYDMELVAPDTTVQRILEGKFVVTPEVTR